MFLIQKYFPHKLSDFIFNRDIAEMLYHISKYDDIPHIILSGPPGAGKKTLANFLLESIYNSSVNTLVTTNIKVKSSSGNKKIEFCQSDYHVLIEPCGTNHDKYILQEIIKNYITRQPYGMLKSSRPFKTVVIYGTDTLSTTCQTSLRRTMEMYAKICRFVMISDNLSKIIDPLRSRCSVFCVPAPTHLHIKNKLNLISALENITVTNNEIDNIIEKSDGNLKKCIWHLEHIKHGCELVLSSANVIDEIVKLLLSINNKVEPINIFVKIRTHIHSLLINQMKGSHIIIGIVDALLKKIDDDKLAAAIILRSISPEYNLMHGRRESIDIDLLTTSIMELILLHI